MFKQPIFGINSPEELFQVLDAESPQDEAFETMNWPFQLICKCIVSESGELGESSPSNPAMPVTGAMRGDAPLSWRVK